MNAAARTALGAWLDTRPQVEELALWLNPPRGRLSARSIDKLLARLGARAGIEGLSAHVLRHTFCPAMVRAGNDVVLVADLAGHRRSTQLGDTACPRRLIGKQRLRRSASSTDRRPSCRWSG